MTGVQLKKVNRHFHQNCNCNSWTGFDKATPSVLSIDYTSHLFFLSYCTDRRCWLCWMIWRVEYSNLRLSISGNCCWMIWRVEYSDLRLSQEIVVVIGREKCFHLKMISHCGGMGIWENTGEWRLEGVRKGIRVGMAGGSLFLDVADVVYCWWCLFSCFGLLLLKSRRSARSAVVEYCTGQHIPYVALFLYSTLLFSFR